MKQVETRKRQNGGPWVVLLIWEDGSSKVLTGYRRKRDAMIAGRAVAMFDQCEHIWTDRHGEYQDRNSYGGDSPRRPG